MKKIEKFKTFVKENPSLVQYVKNNEMTWQKFYELWILYGADNEVWNQYRGEKESKNSGFEDFISMIKKMDMEGFRQGISGLQKGIGLIQDIINDNNQSNNSENQGAYEPRPMFRRFED